MVMDMRAKELLIFLKERSILRGLQNNNFNNNNIANEKVHILITLEGWGRDGYFLKKRIVNRIDS